jgi:hypothetical protein
MADIILEFGADGEMTTEGRGFTGKACDKALKVFEDIGTVKTRKNKREYYETETATQKSRG